MFILRIKGWWVLGQKGMKKNIDKMPTTPTEQSQLSRYALPIVLRRKTEKKRSYGNRGFQKQKPKIFLIILIILKLKFKVKLPIKN